MCVWSTQHNSDMIKQMIVGISRLFGVCFGVPPLARVHAVPDSDCHHSTVWADVLNITPFLSSWKLIGPVLQSKDKVCVRD